MMGKRSIIEGKVTIIVAPAEEEATVRVDGLGLRGIIRADSPAVSSDERPWVPSQVVMSWRRVAGDWEIASLLSRMTIVLDLLERSACSLITADARSGIPFAVASRYEALGVVASMLLIFA